jgi:hypothetical protein
MSRRERIREEIGWLKVIVVLTTSITASLLSWVTQQAPAGPSFGMVLAGTVAIVFASLTSAIVFHVDDLLAELERQPEEKS